MEAGGAASSGVGGASTAPQGGSGGRTSTVATDPDATYLSDTDLTPNEIGLSADRLGAEWLTGGSAGVRSTRAVMPGSGVFYFEATSTADYVTIGVAPASARLDSAAGSTDGGGFDVDVGGHYAFAGNFYDFSPPQNAAFGLVVDYRGSHPTVYLLDGMSKPGSLVTKQTLSEQTQPLYIHLSGSRRAPGFQVHINTGNDVVNWPFTMDPGAVLRGAGDAEVASALVPGWSKLTKQHPLDTPPTLTLDSAVTASIALGDSLTLKASAVDAEDGDLTAQITWDVLSEGNGPERVRGSGGSFTFKPNAIGQHPIQVSVVDAVGKQQTKTVTVTATGNLKQYDKVQLTLEPGLSGDGIELDSDGLRARWTIDQKLGVRANQGLYGDFQYVEGHRLVPAWNQAIGLVIGNVSLNPYAFNVTPPSCSVNGAGDAQQPVSVWQDLISVTKTEIPASSVEYYGLAVDYRGPSPIVYVIVGGKLIQTLHLQDVTVPIYPMLYGNVNPMPDGSQWTGYYEEINFGAKPFHEDPAAVLKSEGVSADGLKVCWGTANCH